MRPYLTLHDPATARDYYEQELWTNDTFYSLLREHAARTPSAMAVRDGKNHLDWLSLKARVDALADDFIDHGIGAGDRVSIWMSNRIEGIIAFLACSRVGAACSPSLHRTYTSAEVVKLLTELKACALFMENGWGADGGFQVGDVRLAALPFLKKVYTPEDLPLHITGLRPNEHRNPDTIAYLAFTSGTTGRPKCVMHSTNTLLANARDLVSDWDITPNEIILSLSPLSHHIAWVGVGQWLTSGCQLVTDDPPSGLTRLDWILESRATYVMGVPTHAMDILAEQRTRNIERLGQVRLFYMAGAPIPEVVATAFTQQGIVPQNIYGMTECSSPQYTHPDDPIDVWVSTCGRGGRAYQMKIWDPTDPDRELPPGETGEIGGRGAAMMLGYFGNQEATEKILNRHGYLMSGDLGSMDGKGNLRIEGRAKDLIIRGGHNIYPSRIEALALTHAGVTKAAAFPIADERLGEKVCLAIIGNVQSSEILDHLAESGLSKFDMPEWFVILTEFPLNAAGKVMKRDLIEMARRGDISPVAVRYAPKKEVSA